MKYSDITILFLPVMHEIEIQKIAVFSDIQFSTKNLCYFVAWYVSTVYETLSMKVLTTKEILK